MLADSVKEKAVIGIKGKYPEYSKVFFRFRNERETLFMFFGNKPNPNNITNITFENSCSEKVVVFFERTKETNSQMFIDTISEILHNSETTNESESETESSESESVESEGAVFSVLNKNEKKLVADIINSDPDEYTDLLNSSTHEDFLHSLNSIYGHLTKPYKLWRRIHEYQKKNNLGW